MKKIDDPQPQPKSENEKADENQKLTVFLSLKRKKIQEATQLVENVTTSIRLFNQLVLSSLTEDKYKILFRDDSPKSAYEFHKGLCECLKEIEAAHIEFLTSEIFEPTLQAFFHFDYNEHGDSPRFYHILESFTHECAPAALNAISQEAVKEL